jgi:hypothetical protein
MPKYNVKGTDKEGDEVRSTVEVNDIKEVIADPAKFGFSTVIGAWPVMDKIGEPDKNALHAVLNGSCPTCREQVSEVKLKDQGYTCRILCLNCKRTGDDFTFGRAYMKFIYEFREEAG